MAFGLEKGTKLLEDSAVCTGHLHSLKLGVFMSRMHESAFEGKNFISLNMLWMTSAHLLPDDFNPYNAFRNIKMYPSCQN